MTDVYLPHCLNWHWHHFFFFPFSSCLSILFNSFLSLFYIWQIISFDTLHIITLYVSLFYTQYSTFAVFRWQNLQFSLEFAKQKTVRSSFLLLHLFLYPTYMNYSYFLFFCKGCENRLHYDQQPAGRTHYPAALADYFYVKCECENLHPSSPP